MSLFSVNQDSAATGRPLRAGFLIAAGVTAATLAIHGIPGVADMLEWHREGPLSATLFGWFTGHFTHWSWDHLVWDLAAFLVLSFAALRLLPGRYPICLMLAAALIPLEIAVNQAHFETYRGLSGIDTALFGLILAGLWKAAAESSGFPWTRTFAFLGGGAFVLKTLYELTSGATLFVSSHSSNFIPAVSAHLTGLAAGLIAGGFSRFQWYSVKQGVTGVQPANDRRDAGLTIEN